MKHKKTAGTAMVPMERITNSILLIRGQKVLLDVDLAGLYGVATKAFQSGCLGEYGDAGWYAGKADGEEGDMKYVVHA